MAEVDDIADGMHMDFQSPALTCASEAVRNAAFPVVVPGVDVHKIEIKQRENELSKKTYARGPITPQHKKELYSKLDDILVTALLQHFEVSPGHIIDRLEMVEFLTNIVQHHVSECPELKKILDLRDTVLTGRVKKAFPEVEYKRKQIKEDHYRKAWLYVNIKRKHSRTSDLSSVTKTMRVSQPRAWTTPVAPGPSTPLSHALSSPSSPTSKDHPPSLCTSYEHCSPTPVMVDDVATVQHQGPLQPGSSLDCMMSTLGPQLSNRSQQGETTGLVLDNLGLQKWVLSHYAQEDLSYVPVQDVVKAFKKDYNVDISYKECHQMILSAFTSPRNRLIPKKTVRVSSVGQQYVYRGIAYLNKAKCSTAEVQDADESERAQPDNQSENAEEEDEEAWKQKIRDITEERDQALMERNQALAAFMELEKEHVDAVRTIEKLKEENSRHRFVDIASKKRKDALTKGEVSSANHCEGSCVGNFMLKLSDTKRDGRCHATLDGKRDKTTNRDFKNDCKREQCDYTFLREVVSQAKEERDHLLKSLEIVKSERNSYLDRLHVLEKENQRLRDAVNVKHSDLFQNRLLDDIARHFQTNCHDETNAKEALSSVLSHLRSKRKQVTPSRLNKSPKYDHTNLDEQNPERNSVDDRRSRSEECLSPASALHSGASSPGKLTVSNIAELHNGKESLCNDEAGEISSNGEGNLGGEERRSKDDLLVFTSGSAMIGFTRHPMED